MKEDHLLLASILIWASLSSEILISGFAGLAGFFKLDTNPAIRSKTTGIPSKYCKIKIGMESLLREIQL